MHNALFSPFIVAAATVGLHVIRNDDSPASQLVRSAASRRGTFDAEAADDDNELTWLLRAQITDVTHKDNLYHHKTRQNTPMRYTVNLTTLP